LILFLTATFAAMLAKTRLLHQPTLEPLHHLMPTPLSLALSLSLQLCPFLTVTFAAMLAVTHLLLLPTLEPLRH
jgi:dolichyl-phosphate-mannose--protein O-mannosyl transferase